MANKHLEMARTFARIMDSQFSIFGFRFGLDGILGLLPGAGDVISMILSAYLIWIAFQMNIPKNKIAQMVYNIAIDALIGSVPVLGDIADFLYKANLKNLQILEEFDSDIIQGEIDNS